MEAKHIEIIKMKIKQREKDLSLIIELSKKVDKIKTAKIKVVFDDLVTENIMSIGKDITSFKKYIREEEEKLDVSLVEGDE